MNLARIRRIGIALTAAYAMALQALLLSFVPLPTAALGDSLSALCAYDDTGKDGPAQHQVPCVAVCAAMGHGTAGAVPQAVADIVAPGMVVAAIAPPAGWVATNIALT